MKKKKVRDKEVYTAPRLKVHGTVADLTQNMGTGGSDGETGSRIL